MDNKKWFVRVHITKGWHVDIMDAENFQEHPFHANQNMQATPVNHGFLYVFRANDQGGASCAPSVFNGWTYAEWVLE